MKKIVKNIINFLRITMISLNDYINYIKYCGFPYNKKDKIEWRILLLSHSLEKGLSIQNPRIDFGIEKASDLKKLLIIYDNKESYVYKEGISVLSAYIDYRKKNNLDYGLFVIPNVNFDSKGGGITKLTINDVKYNETNFIELCKKRHSVRNFSAKYVSIDDVKKAVQIALTCPSACNRQMIKVYTTNDIKKNSKIAKLIPGNIGFKDENCRYLILTSDMKAFDYYEINQWYLNGGIFISYLQLAFTSNNIGSCIYQWPKIKDNNKKLKQLLNIPKNEEVLTILAVGYYKDDFVVLKAKRKNVDDVLIQRK